MSCINDSCIHPELYQLEYSKALCSTPQQQFYEIHQRR